MATPRGAHAEWVRFTQVPLRRFLSAQRDGGFGGGGRDGVGPPKPCACRRLAPCEAAKALDEYEDIDRSKVSTLLTDLVKDRETAPVRYRL